MGTQIIIEDALALLLKPMRTSKGNFFSWLNQMDMANAHAKEFPHSRLGCTTHTLSPLHMLHIRQSFKMLIHSEFGMTNMGTLEYGWRGRLSAIPLVTI
jgi:hypothetical protein